MPRTRDAVTKDLRDSQKQLTRAKSHHDKPRTNYLKARMAELQKEYDAIA